MLWLARPCDGGGPGLVRSAPRVVAGVHRRQDRRRAAYLIFLGIRTVLGARRETSFRDGAKVDPWAAYRQGILTNVLDPKVAIFFLSLLPQFVEPGPGFTWRLLVLSGLFIVLGLVWLTIYTIALHAVTGFVDRPRVKTIIETVTGSVLMALGVRLAFQRR